jgi:hypothetical protein
MIVYLEMIGTMEEGTGEFKLQRTRCCCYERTGRASWSLSRVWRGRGARCRPAKTPEAAPHAASDQTVSGACKHHLIRFTFETFSLQVLLPQIWSAIKITYVVPSQFPPSPQFKLELLLGSDSISNPF